MAISYPLSMPEAGKFAKITLRSVNAVVLSSSPFTFAQQAIAWPGQRWEADVTLPRMPRDDAEDWAGWLTALRGQFGTFPLGDSLAHAPRGTATAATVTGAAGSGSITVAMTGSLRRGDYLQIGTGAAATLHKVLLDQTGSGTLEVWPDLRRDVSAVAAVLANPRGLFRLSQNSVEWEMPVDQIMSGIAFSAIEVIQ